MLDRPTVFLAGTAGAGKTTLAGALREYLGEQGMDAVLINLDPGAEKLPYEPEIDIREWVRLDDIMSDLGLGPNGAQVAAADLIAVNLTEVAEACGDMKPDLFIVDTPGQLELFAFRASGPFVMQTLSRLPFLCFLLDPVVAQKPRGLVSQMLLAATVHFRLQVPTVNVVSKLDVLPQATADAILGWAADHDVLMDALAKEPVSLATRLNEGIARTIDDFSALARTVGVSAHTGEGLEDLYAVLTGLFSGGEREIPR